jgi:transcriptional regulator
MYAPTYARVKEEADALAMIAAHPFATFIVAPELVPLIAYAPFVRDPEHDRVLIGHVARANPVWQGIGEGCEAVASFRGPDAYVSPSLYPSKYEHGRVVPTWNYLAVEVRGRASIETDSSRLRPYVEAITAVMESRQKFPWHVSDAPGDYIAKLCGAIIGIRIAISDVSGVRKLSQNRDEADYSGVMNGMMHDAQPLSSLIADAMRRETKV